MYIQTCEQGKLTEFEVRPKTKVYCTWNAVVEWSLTRAKACVQTKVPFIHPVHPTFTNVTWSKIAKSSLITFEY